MGSSCSKSPRSSRDHYRFGGGRADAATMQLTGVGFGDSEVRVESIHRDDQMAMNVIRSELHDNSEMFVLNNVLMAVQFFSDHKEVITKMRQESSSPEEKEMNKILLKDETVECTYPDTILDEVNKNVLFRTREEDSVGENLAPKRMYVINDLIEVVNSKEVPQYTSIDKPCYQVRIEETDRKGFVKLTQIQNNSVIFANREYDENYEALPGPSSRSDSEYSYITDLRTPKQIEVNSTFERRDTLPETCFTQRTVKCTPDDDLDESDYEERMAYLENLDESDFLKVVTYINSKGFMKYFQNTLLPTSLGKSLGFDDVSVQSAKAIPGKIFCEDLDIETNVRRTYEIIPAVGIQWPAEQTIDFIAREERPTIIDTRSGIKYRWPTDDKGGMVDEMMQLNAVLVPKGYTQKKGINPDSSLEWEINFPKAERYLEARMSHAQTKCFLLLLTLHKTYIAPVTNQYGLLPEHIRTHMYWECEKDYRHWPEHRLGVKIILVLKTLTKRLYQGALNDYFIKQKNMFENIPKKYLNFAQKVFLDVLDNPVPYFVSALSNLRYTSGKFYPPVDFKDLFNVLTTKDSVGLVNAKLASYRIKKKTRVFKTPEQQIQHIREMKIKQKIMAQRLKEKEDKILEAKKVEMEMKMRSDIDMERKIDKHLDLFKTDYIMQFFIKLFIDIAKKSYSISTKEQALFYLKQAFYLTRIFQEESESFKESANEYQQQISMEEQRIKRKSLRTASISESKPPTPVKNGIAFQFDISPHAKTGSIRLNNLQTAFVNGGQSPQPPPAMRNLKPHQIRERFVENSHMMSKKKTVAFAT